MYTFTRGGPLCVVNGMNERRCNDYNLADHDGVDGSSDQRHHRPAMTKSVDDDQCRGRIVVDEDEPEIGTHSSFLSRVSILLLTRDIDIVILSVCPSVRLSVTRWYCMKTA